MRRFYVAPREGRVSRNYKIAIDEMRQSKSRPAKGV